MKKITLIIGMALCILMPGCTKKSSNTDEHHNILVVYFSHAGDNYAVGEISKGNTKIIAEYIKEFSQADELEIVTSKYDGMEYNALCALAQEEQISNERPDFTARLVRGANDTVVAKQADIDKYDMIFIGGPVWWGTYPQVMFSFFDKYDLSGKILIPFTTHEGSGLGNCVGDLKAAYPTADVWSKSALSIYGHEAIKSKIEVKEWLAEMGLVK